jgi:leucyl-tRNA synthetase
MSSVNVKQETASVKYDFRSIEKRWQERWHADDLFRTPEDRTRPKFYGLDFFPYPSGDGLSVGHCRNYVPSDVFCRYRRMRGDNVLHPMGWDAFGLPAENEAIRRRSHPKKTVPQYVANYKRQMNLLGLSYDWSREINSSEPEYYRWTQWFFLLLYRRGLAYRSAAPANWCPSCATVLANEEVHDGACWRCGAEIEKKDLPQWFFRITEYADRLLEDLKLVDWPESIKLMQTNWIGRSVGVEFDMPIVGHDAAMRVFTTRVDTVFGVSFAVLAPEHPLVAQITAPDRREEVEEYVRKSRRVSEIDRMSTERERDGCFTGAFAVNPVNGQEVPVYVADYVLLSYGTGAIMAVPAHDARDFDFARRYGLPAPVVIAPEGWDGRPLQEAHTGEGVMVNSGQFSGMRNTEGAEAIADWMEQRGIGQRRVNYRLRDWLISRQRYWGAPIPIVHCPSCGEVPVPEEQLPVLLPDVENYEPPGDGRSPLAAIPEFVNTACPECGGPAQRETDTMGGFACSSWYFLRFADPHNDRAPFDREKVEYWLPVDLYVGGAEHAVMHLLYARFWTKVMYDAGLVPFVEPFTRLKNQGMLLAPDPKNPGVLVKMSKSKFNVVTPDEMAEKYGADALRVYELFVAPFEDTVPWSEDGINGCWRFLNRVYRVVAERPGSFVPGWKASVRQETVSEEARALARKTHQTIVKVTKDIEDFAFNTAVAALMELTNQIYDFVNAKDGLRYPCPVWSEAVETLILLLAPMAPHLSDELWQMIGREGYTYHAPWPEADPEVAKADVLTIVVQVNGKVRDKISVDADAGERELERLALESPKVQAALQGRPVRKVIVVPGRLVNVVG